MKKSRVAEVIATWFGCGYSRVAPGTAGSAAALAIAALLAWRADWQGWHFGLLAAAGTVPGAWAAGVTSRQSKAKDPSLVVVDEVLGQWLTLAGAPSLHWPAFAAAFLLFRLFDIWKPYPIRRLEALPGGMGIVADDLGAGLYAALVLFAAGYWISS